MRIAYSPDLDVFPVDPRIATVVGDAVEAFEEAGADVEEVELGITRDQRELSDLWCRLIIPLNDRRPSSACVRSGFDLLGEHRDDFPPEYRAGSTAATGMTRARHLRDQEMRTEVYDAVQGVFDRLRPARHARRSRHAGRERRRRRHGGPARGQRRRGRPLIGWCPTYPFNFTGPPGRVDPGRAADGLPVGMQIIGRRYADADVLAAERRVRAAPPVVRPYPRAPSGRLS